MATNPYNPAKDRPRNQTHAQIKNIHERLIDAGREEQAAKLENRRAGTSAQASRAKALQAEYLSGDGPSLETQIEEALEERNASEDERKAVESRLTRAKHLSNADEEYAEGLQESALALAKHGPAKSHVEDLSDNDRARVDDLLNRASMIEGPAEDYAAELREEAESIVEDTVTSNRRNTEEVVIDRDVEATMDALESGDTLEAENSKGDESTEQEFIEARIGSGEVNSGPASL